MSKATHTYHPFRFQAVEYVMVNNAVFDVLMQRCPANAFKVLMCVIRQTHGWLDFRTGERKQSDAISYTQIQEMTGIGSYTTVAASLKWLTDEGYIIPTRATDPSKATTYTLNTEFSIERTTENVVRRATESVGPRTTESVDTKETPKDKVKNTTTDSPHPTGAGTPEQSSLALEPPKARKKKQPTPNGEAHQQVMSVYNGHATIHGAKEGASIKRMLNAGYTAEEITTCYWYIKGQPFYQDKHLCMSKVAEDIASWKQNGGKKVPPAPARGAPPRQAAERARMAPTSLNDLVAAAAAR